MFGSNRLALLATISRQLQVLTSTVAACPSRPRSKTIDEDILAVLYSIDNKLSSISFEIEDLSKKTAPHGNDWGSRAPYSGPTVVGSLKKTV